jgi:DNA-binding NarL/FixJ family response regulator
MINVSVTIADDHRLFVESIKLMLNASNEFNFEVMDEAGNGDEAVEVLKKRQPNLLLLDLNMPGKDGLNVLGEIRSMLDHTAILVLTMYEDEKLFRSVMKAGADGYLLKSSGKEELFTAIRMVLEGITYQPALTPAETQTEVVQRREFEDNFMKKYNLTKRELEVLKLIAQAMSNKQIGRELYISDQTVGVHRKNIMRKLGVNNAAGLMRIAYDSHIL